MAEETKLTGSDIDNILDAVDEKQKGQEYFRQIIDNPWLPNDEFVDKWLTKLLSHATTEEKKLAIKMLEEVKKDDQALSKSDLHFFGQRPIISTLRVAVENNPIMRKLCTAMVDEVSEKHPKSPIRKVKDLLLILNIVLGRAPTYNDDHNKINSLPLASAFGRYASTKSGKELFNRPDITQIFGQYLEAYKEYLDSPESTKVLYEKPDGWLVNEGALEIMQMEDYEIPKSGKFSSWNQYFSRGVIPSARPISQPNNDAIIVSPIDGVIYNIEHDVQEYSEFWIKRQPYSLRALLNNDDKYIKQFIGGSVWQSFLDPFNYHRWHTPVAGKVVDIVQVGGLNPTSKDDLLTSQGLYYSILKWEGFGDFKDWTGSLPYMAMVNRRAIVYIESDLLGLVAVIPVGMLEVSSCILNKKNGHPKDKLKKDDVLKKGDQLGMFQYGGSTFALVFQKDKVRNFTILPPKNIQQCQLPVTMGTKIAVAQSKQN